MALRHRRSRTTRSRLLLDSLESRLMLTVTLDPIASVYGSTISLPAFKSIIVPLTASTTLSGPLTYTVAASSPSLVPMLNAIDTSVATTRTFIRISTSLGDMDFQLFNDVAPITTGWLLSHLSSPDFVNSIFQRIIQGAIVQGGDRTGDGMDSNPGLALQQELDPRVIYSGHGQLAEARMDQPDTGSSQFFITVGNQRSLDFGYSIYGQLVRGWDVLTAMNNLPTDPDTDRPLSPPTLIGISVIPDQTDAVLTLLSTSVTPMNGSITVTVKDTHGNQALKIFNVSTFVDPVNDPPYLNPPSQVNRIIPKNTTTTVLFGGYTDIEHNAASISGQFISNPSHFTASFNSDFTGLIVTPDAGYSGVLQLVVNVAQTNNTALTTGRTYTFVVDNGTGPTATTRVTDVYASASPTYTFSVTFTDDTQVSAASLIGNNNVVTVAGPNGYMAKATYVSIDSVQNGPTRTVRYQIAAPGGSWDAADAGAYVIVVNAGAVKDVLGDGAKAAAIGVFYYSPSAFFDERYYLAMNPGVAAAVAKHQFASGWQHFQAYGQQEGLAATPYFNEALYRALYPAIAAAVAAGGFKSGWQHFVLYGAREGLVASPVFNEAQYLAMYPGVATAVANHVISSGLEHFILYGQFQGFEPSVYFDLNAYAALYPGVVAAVNAGAAGVAQTVTEHFLIYGQEQGLQADTLFNESYYLSQYPTVAAAVRAGTYKSGFEQFILFGAHAGLNPSAGFDSQFYLSRYPGVAAAVANGAFDSAFEHYLLYGRAEGLQAHA